MYRFSRAVIHFIASIVFRLSWEGLENIPADGGYVVVSNHHSLIDPAFLAIRFRRQLFFMAKAELFRNKLLGWWLSKCGAFPVNRGEGDKGSLEHAVEIVQRGDLLGIFPEGTRSRTGVPSRPKSGAAYIAAAAKCGILPCAVIFDGPLKIGKKVKLVVGKPISYEEMGWTDDKASLKRVSKRIMAEIIALMGESTHSDEDTAQ